VFAKLTDFCVDQWKGFLENHQEWNLDVIFLKRLKCSLRAKWDRVVLRNALEVCAPLKECRLMLEAGTYIRVEASTEY